MKFFDSKPIPLRSRSDSPPEVRGQSRNAAGNMTLPVEVYDIGVCLDLLEAVIPLGVDDSVAKDVHSRLARLLSSDDRRTER